MRLPKLVVWWGIAVAVCGVCGCGGVEDGVGDSGGFEKWVQADKKERGDLLPWLLRQELLRNEPLDIGLTRLDGLAKDEVTALMGPPDGVFESGEISYSVVDRMDGTAIDRALKVSPVVDNLTIYFDNADGTVSYIALVR